MDNNSLSFSNNPLHDDLNISSVCLAAISYSFSCNESLIEGPLA